VRARARLSAADLHAAAARACPSSSPPGEGARNGRKSFAKERQRAERDQLTRLLKESPGKRDARNFLKHFDQPKPKPRPEPSIATAHAHAHHETGVNLGNLYEPTKAIQNSPVFSREEPTEKPLQLNDLEPVHLALVKLRQPQALDDETLGGIALTLSQMARLGLNIAVVMDCDDANPQDAQQWDPAWEMRLREQASHLVSALEDFNEPGAFLVDHALYYTANPSQPSHARVQVRNTQLLFPPIEDGIIPVIPPFAYDSEFRKVRVDADHALLALTREFSGLGAYHVDAETPTHFGGAVLDRIIVLDPLGGIPSEHRADGAHVFINLEAEYKDVREELGRVEPPFLSSYPSKTRGSLSRHTKNLDMVQKALKLLPPSSSALIITPAEAAISSQSAQLPTPSASVRTRRSKNPLIHNLLTNKPMTSSSLPDSLVTRPLASAAPNSATFLKKGIPVTILPDPRVTGPWQPPSPSNPAIELNTDPRINFPRLVDLIEDSFRRKLDVKDYLDRVRGRIAGVIIAGDYEGGAICTWETPSFLPYPPPADSPLWVPYLDKFAVLTSSQGSGGVADIVWGALTRTAFPKGVCWRSRTTNPVNKWYFERAVGMWNLPDEYWTMFWTTDGVVEEWAKKERLEGNGQVSGVSKAGPTRWDAYVNVCSEILPSWADNKKPD